MLKVPTILYKKLCLFNTININLKVNVIYYHVQSSLLKEYKHQKIKKSLAMERIWQPELDKLETNDTKNVKNYKLLSYNILAQDLLVEHLHLYYTIDNKMLRWDNRLNKLKDEIAALKPDILCLQEMQYDHLKNLVNQFNVVKQNSRLEYVFKKKTGTRSDGCAVIYDKNKFKLISEHYVEYYTDGIATLNRENIGMMVKLQPQDDNTATFVVATTHLLYNPRREDVRISQVNKLLQAIIDFSYSVDTKERLPVILTGDFNFTRNSRAFQILTALRKPKQLQENTKDDQQNDDFFQMDAIDFGCDKGASTYQNEWVTVDYILKSLSKKYTKSIKVNSAYLLPSVNQCCRNGLIPNKYVGSDHFSLAINFSIV